MSLADEVTIAAKAFEAKNYVEARRRFGDAAEQGHTAAQNMLAYMLKGTAPGWAERRTRSRRGSFSA